MRSTLLIEARKKRGWTQAQVAEAVSVDVRTVSRWERGKAFPYPYYREQLCLLFGKTAQQLGLCSADEEGPLQAHLQMNEHECAGSLCSADEEGPLQAHLQMNEHECAGSLCSADEEGPLQAHLQMNEHECAGSLCSADEEGPLEETTSLGIQSTAPDSSVQVCLSADPSIAQSLQGAKRLPRGEPLVMQAKEHLFLPLKRARQINRSTFFLLVFFCLLIVASSMYAAFFPGRTSKPEKPVKWQRTTVDDSIQGTGLSQFDYVGNGWQSYVGSSCSGMPNCTYENSNSWDHTTGDFVTFPFRGVQIKFYGVLDPKHGIGAISLDGGSETMIDFYSARRLGDQLMWTSPMLSAGTHTFKLRVTGTKNPSSTDYYVAVDRVDILS